MSSCHSFLMLAMSLTLVTGQRPSFAGTRPIGFPEVVKPTTDAGLGNRFGEDGVTTTTMRLPIEANGDRDLIDRLSKLPIDQQPFWFINWQALEAHRQNPQTFPQKPNVFINPENANQAPSQQSSTFNQVPMNQPNFNQGQMNSNRPPTNVNQGQFTPNQPSTSSQLANDLSNRFSDMDLAKPISSNVQATTLQELYNSQRIVPVKNPDGTTSWQIVDKSVVDALQKIHNKEQQRA